MTAGPPAAVEVDVVHVVVQTDVLLVVVDVDVGLRLAAVALYAYLQISPAA